LGIAESTVEDRCLFCGAVVRADRAVDGVGFASATVGGLDATDAVRRLIDRLDRDDVRYLLVSGVAPAWFNVLDVAAIAEAADRPTIAVSYEASPGLAPAIDRAFEGAARDRRLAAYDRLPPRRRVTVNGETLFARSVGFDGVPGPDTGDADGAPAEVARVLDAFTPAGGRPEPVRVARLAARGVQAWHTAPDRHG
jgi:endonuclease V-like protein UPF0215 family